MMPDFGFQAKKIPADSQEMGIFWLSAGIYAYCAFSRLITFKIYVLKKNPITANTAMVMNTIR